MMKFRSTSSPASLPEGSSASNRSPSSSMVFASASSGGRAMQRRMICRYMVFGAALAAGGLVDDGVAWRRFIAEHRTDIGEQRTVSLDDSIRLILNTHTALNVEQHDDQQEIHLLQGELFLAQPVNGRHVSVLTSQGRIDSAGGQFVVRREGDDTRLTVLSGSATVAPRKASASRQTLAAGQHLGFDRAAIQAVRPSSEADTAWVDGYIIARDMRLVAFLDELQRYCRERLSCDPAVASMPVSGRFPLADVNQVLSWLTSQMPLQVDTQGARWGRQSLMLRAIG
ncbi:MAG: FecR domain-containing protein [Lautropia sp.]|nr:FecR domain-containing protein [Lautropia sp.]